jgi:hypothetical protein
MTSDWFRRGAAAVALGRTALGVAALVSPTLIARPWVGEVSGPALRVLGRALGGRDLALGLGALAALRQDTGAGAAWVGAGALSDSLDVLATLTAWRELPPAGRWLVLGTAGGAALAGAVGAWALLSGQAADGT